MIGKNIFRGKSFPGSSGNRVHQKTIKTLDYKRLARSLSR